MKITYDTVADRISCPDLTDQQTAQLQGLLSSALARNTPVREVAALLMSCATTAKSSE